MQLFVLLVFLYTFLSFKRNSYTNLLASSVRLKLTCGDLMLNNSGSIWKRIHLEPSPEKHWKLVSCGWGGIPLWLSWWWDTRRNRLVWTHLCFKTDVSNANKHTLDSDKTDLEVHCLHTLLTKCSLLVKLVKLKLVSSLDGRGGGGGGVFLTWWLLLSFVFFFGALVRQWHFLGTFTQSLAVFHFPLRKHAYSNTLKIVQPKKGKF